jgi:ABC-2 type transport system ATP-binding protein
VTAVAGRALAVRFGGRRGRTVFAGLDVEIGAGEIVAVLGPNGAGKTTLLAVLAARRRPSAGVVHLFGTDVARAPASVRRRLGIVPDEVAHLDPLSGTENAAFFARAAGLTGAAVATALEPLFERFALSADAGRPVAEYSLGMRRKLALIEALAHAPDLLVLDEPTVGLDPAARAALRDVLRERAAAGAAVLLATNDVHDLHHWVSRVLFLHRGRVVLDGAPAELLRSLGGVTSLTLRFTAPHAPALTVAGAAIVAVSPTELVAHSADGAAPLPALCAALLEAGAAIHAVEIAAPDLRDVFARATGAALAP